MWHINLTFTFLHSPVLKQFVSRLLEFAPGVVNVLAASQLISHASMLQLVWKGILPLAAVSFYIPTHTCAKGLDSNRIQADEHPRGWH